MTTLQKITITVALSASLGAGLYEANQAAAARAALRQLQSGQSPLDSPAGQLQSEYVVATNGLARALAEIDQLKADSQGLELKKLRSESEQLRDQLQAIAQAAAVGSSNSPVATPPLAMSLYKYPDSAFGFNARTTGTNVGLATPAATIQTWLWALRHGSDEDLKSIWDFPAGVSEEIKQNIAKSPHRIPNNPNEFYYYQVIAMFPLGNDEYYAWIAEIADGGISSVMKKVLRQEGGEWKMYYDPASLHGTDD